MLRECERVLHQNWTHGELEGKRFSYTRPSPRRYPWQWYRDSCLAAVAWRRFDPSRPRAELESLLLAAHDDGFTGHTIFWGKPVHDVWPARKGPKVEAWATLSPLALPDLPQEIGRRLVEEHLLDPERFCPPVPPPSVAADERTFSMKDRFFGLRRYRPGPTWVNSAWLVWLGLLRLGYENAATTVVQALLETVVRERPREYHDPNAGTGMGARDFAWAALVSEFVAGDPRAATSYL